MTPRPSRLLAALAATSLLVAACSRGPEEGEEVETTDGAAATTPEGTGGGAAPTTAGDTEATEPPDDTAADTTTGDTEGGETTEGGGGGEAWAVATDDCIDPDLVNAPIEGTVSIGSSMPLSGGVAAAAFGPVAEGFRAYIEYANEQGLLPEHDVELNIGDDQYDPAQTPNVVNGLLDAGVNLFSGIIGSPNNAAVRDVLNEECVPQMLALTGSPAWGEVADYPWTTGGLIPYNIESEAYVEHIAEQFPDGATAALFTVANDFGEVYRTAFEAAAEEAGIEIVDTQTIEAADSAPPSAQLNSIAGNQPDVIMAVPLGAQCPTFMTELANAKAVQTGWDPQVYITNTCASPLILGIAGEAANGLITSASGGLKDVSNPEVVATDPDVQGYIDYMTNRGNGDIVTTAAAGWNIGEVTVEILRQAAESPEGLTQASIINTARNFDYAPALTREGVDYKMAGEEDAFYAEDIQIVQYDAATAHFVDVGELITTFRSS